MKYFAILIWCHQIEEVKKKLYRKSYQKGNAVLAKAIRGLAFLIQWSSVKPHTAEKNVLSVLAL